MTRNDALSDLLSALQNADSVLLLCHLSPDGDTLGSALALYLRLTRIGKRVSVALDDEVPVKLRFLPGVNAVCKPVELMDAQDFDLALAIDVASEERMGACGALFAKARQTGLIDHHGTNPGYAALNCIDGNAPAAAVLVYALMMLMPQPVTREEAICLYTALSTDTGNFIYDTTNAEAFRMMERLMEAGLPVEHYGRILFREKELGFVRLLGVTLPTLRISQNGRMAGLSLSLAQKQACEAQDVSTDGIVDYAIDIEGVRVAYFAKESAPGCVKVSLRSLEPYQVDTIALHFNGGGHAHAAGCTLCMPLDAAIQAVESALAGMFEAEA